MIEVKQILIPLALFIFISIVVIIGLGLLFQYLNKRLALQTALDLINNNETGNNYSLLELLVKEQPKQNFDLRVGCLSLVISIAFIIIGFVIGSYGYLIVKLSMFGMGLFPGLIGLTFLGFHFFKIKNN